MDSRKQQGVSPMEVDPIDDGPPPSSPPTPAVASSHWTPSALLTPIVLTKEEEAKQAIESLRAEDMAQRVTAAHRLPAIAAVLGPERTRNVSVEAFESCLDQMWHCFGIILKSRHLFYRN